MVTLAQLPKIIESITKKVKTSTVHESLHGVSHKKEYVGKIFKAFDHS